MLIGVISDTHDRLPAFKNAVALFKERKVEAILHAGDYVAPFAAKLIAMSVVDTPVYCIYGNNDGEKAGLKKTLPQIVDGPLTVTMAGRKIVMHHFIDWLTAKDMEGADVVITGHTHSIVNEVKDGRLMLNPGECCGWLTGRCTVALLDLKTLKAEIVDVKPD